MRHGRGILITAIVLMAVGALGAVAGAVVSASNRTTVTPRVQQRGGGVTSGGFRSNGERIYFTGVGHAGPVPSQWDPSGGGMMRGRGMRGPGCVRCHGASGRGGVVGMMGFSVETPDIRYSTLTSPHKEDTATVPGWTEPQIEQAIRDGIEPNGDRLDPFMPRWDMDAQDMKDTIGYLKELSQR